MIGNACGRREQTEGQSLLEVALVLPILLLLLVFVVDVARAFDAQIVLKNAAREGARFGSLADPLSPDEIRHLVWEDVVGSGTNVTHMANFSESNVDIDEGTRSVTVTLSYDFPLWFGGMVGIDTLNISAEAVMPRRGDLAGP
ncbi:MAG: pilus assembly protein [Anaerolineae bacterium]|nr:pilus assembly protein [Anaerolineae bacterium]